MNPFRQLLIRRGLKADLPVGADGELLYAEDTKELFIGTQFNGNQKVNASYSPASPGNWSGPSPANLIAAVDRLAAAVAGLLGGPIP